MGRRDVFELPLFGCFQLVIDVLSLLLFRDDLKNASFQRFQLCAIVFQLLNQRFLIGDCIAQINVLVEECLKQLGVPHRVLRDLGQVALLVELDAKRPLVVDRFSVLILGGDSPTAPSLALVSIPYTVRVFAEHDCGVGAVVVVLKCCVSTDGVANGLDDGGLPSAPAANEAIEIRAKAVAAAIDSLNPAWLLRMPLLGELLGLPMPDNPTTAAFDPKLRQEALISLAVEIAQTRAQGQPLLLLFEDVHWIDEASQGILLALARVVASAPILLVLVQRPPTRENEPFLTEVAALPNQTYLPLDE